MSSPEWRQEDDFYRKPQTSKTTESINVFNTVFNNITRQIDEANVYDDDDNNDDDTEMNVMVHCNRLYTDDDDDENDPTCINNSPELCWCSLNIRGVDCSVDRCNIKGGQNLDNYALKFQFPSKYKDPTFVDNRTPTEILRDIYMISTSMYDSKLKTLIDNTVGYDTSQRLVKRGVYISEKGMRNLRKEFKAMKLTDKDIPETMTVEDIRHPYHDFKPKADADQIKKENEEYYSDQRIKKYKKPRNNKNILDVNNTPDSQTINNTNAGTKSNQHSDAKLHREGIGLDEARQDKLQKQDNNNLGNNNSGIGLADSAEDKSSIGNAKYADSAVNVNNYSLCTNGNDAQFQTSSKECLPTGQDNNSEGVQDKQCMSGQINDVHKSNVFLQPTYTIHNYNTRYYIPEINSDQADIILNNMNRTKSADLVYLPLLISTQLNDRKCQTYGLADTGCSNFCIGSNHMKELGIDADCLENKNKWKLVTATTNGKPVNAVLGTFRIDVNILGKNGIAYPISVSTAVLNHSLQHVLFDMKTLKYLQCRWDCSGSNTRLFFSLPTSTFHFNSPIEIEIVSNPNPDILKQLKIYSTDTTQTKPYADSMGNKVCGRNWDSLEPADYILDDTSLDDAAYNRNKMVVHEHENNSDMLIPNFETCTKEEIKQLEKLYERYSAVFTTNKFMAGRYPHFKVSMPTIPGKIVREKPRSHNLEQLKYGQPLIDGLLANGIIEEAPANSPWATNILVQAKLKIRENSKAAKFNRKADGLPEPTSDRYRLLLDMRGLNKISILVPPTSFEKQTNINLRMKGKVATVLDVSNSFYSCELDDDAKEKSTFHWAGRLYRLRRMAQGYTNSSFHQNRLFSEVFDRKLVEQFKNTEKPDFDVDKFLNSLSHFSDDFVLVSESRAIHMDHLHCVLHLLKQANLLVNKSKIRVFVTKFDFLNNSYDLNDRSIALDKTRIKAILAWKTPSSLAHLQSYLSSLQYVSNFVINFKALSFPLFDLVRSRKFVWCAQMQKYFNNLKFSVGLAITLTLPDPTKAACIFNDASVCAGSSLYMQWNKELDDFELVSVHSVLFSKTLARRFILHKELTLLSRSCELHETLIAQQQNFIAVCCDALAVLHARDAKSKNSSINNISLLLGNFSKLALLSVSSQANFSADVYSRIFYKKAQLQDSHYNADTQWTNKHTKDLKFITHDDLMEFIWKDVDKYHDSREKIDEFVEFDNPFKLTDVMNIYRENTRESEFLKLAKVDTNALISKHTLWAEMLNKPKPSQTEVVRLAKKYGLAREDIVKFLFCTIINPSPKNIEAYFNTTVAENSQEEPQKQRRRAQRANKHNSRDTRARNQEIEPRRSARNKNGTPKKTNTNDDAKKDEDHRNDDVKKNEDHRHDDVKKNEDHRNDGVKKNEDHKHDDAKKNEDHRHDDVKKNEDQSNDDVRKNEDKTTGKNEQTLNDENDYKCILFFPEETAFFIQNMKEILEQFQTKENQELLRNIANYDNISLKNKYKLLLQCRQTAERFLNTKFEDKPEFLLTVLYSTNNESQIVIKEGENCLNVYLKDDIIIKGLYLLQLNLLIYQKSQILYFQPKEVIKQLISNRPLSQYCGHHYFKSLYFYSAKEIKLKAEKPIFSIFGFQATIMIKKVQPPVEMECNNPVQKCNLDWAHKYSILVYKCIPTFFENAFSKRVHEEYDRTTQLYNYFNDFINIWFENKNNDGQILMTYSGDIKQETESLDIRTKKHNSIANIINEKTNDIIDRINSIAFLHIIFQNKLTHKALFKLLMSDQTYRNHYMAVQETPSEYPEFYFLNDFLMRKEKNPDTLKYVHQLFVSKSLARMIITYMHAQLQYHINAKPIIKLFKQQFFCYGLTGLVKAASENCLTCIMARAPQIRRNPSSDARSIEASRAGECFWADLAHSLPQTTAGMTAILVVCDQYSQYCCIEPVANLEAKETMRALLRVFQYTNFPAVLVSDHGSSFKAECERMLAKYGIIHHKSSTRVSEENGLCEVMIRETKRFLTKMILNGSILDRANWDLAIPYLQISLNSLCEERSHVSRSKLFHGSRYYQSFSNQTLIDDDDDDAIAAHRLLENQRSRFRHSLLQENKRFHPGNICTEVTTNKNIDILQNSRYLRPALTNIYVILGIKNKTAYVRSISSSETKTIPLSRLRKLPFEHLQQLELNPSLFDSTLIRSRSSLPTAPEFIDTATRGLHNMRISRKLKRSIDDAMNISKEEMKKIEEDIEQFEKNNEHLFQDKDAAKIDAPVDDIRDTLQSMPAPQEEIQDEIDLFPTSILKRRGAKLRNKTKIKFTTAEYTDISYSEAYELIRTTIKTVNLTKESGRVRESREKVYNYSLTFLDTSLHEITVLERN